MFMFGDERLIRNNINNYYNIIDIFSLKRLFQIVLVIF